MLDINNSILIVLDDQNKLQKLAQVLHAIGYREIYHVHENAQAQKAVVKYKPDIIIQDIELIQMDGLGFLSWLIEQQYPGGVCLFTDCEERLLRTIRSMAGRTLSYLGDVRHDEVSIGTFASVLGARVSDGKSEQQKIELPSKRVLSKAITAQEFCLYAQPKVSAHSLECVGVELLARWNKGGEVLSPAHFVPVLQKNPDLLAEFDRMVVTLGTQAAAKLHAEFPNMHVAVNTSTPSYNLPAFTEHLMMQVFMSGLDINRFVLELTESHPLKQSGLECLVRLAMNGIRLSIDDFGTHFSNFDKLYTAPFSEVKIDRFVVQRSTHDHVAHSILSNSISIAHDMDIKVTVEGVEDRDQLKTISALGADYVQGFLFAKPMSLDELMQWQEDQLRDWGKVQAL